MGRLALGCTDMHSISWSMLAEEAAKDAQSTKVAATFEAFQNQVGPWFTVSEKACYDRIFGKYSLKG